MTSLVVHCSPRSSFSWLLERGFFFWWKTPLIAVSTPALSPINHVKWLEKRDYQARCLSTISQVRKCHLLCVFVVHLNRWSHDDAQLHASLRGTLCSLIRCYRWDCYLGEELQVSGENQSHAIPHTPIKTPAQGRDLILIHCSCSGFRPSNYLWCSPRTQT